MLGELPEASGLALSVRTPGVIWSMNDSGVPLIYGSTRWVASLGESGSAARYQQLGGHQRRSVRR
jgi:hypothetical protein